MDESQAHARIHDLEKRVSELEEKVSAAGSWMATTDSSLAEILAEVKRITS